MIETAVDYKHLYEQSTIEIASLKQELNNLKRLIYGSKNERFIPVNGSSSQLSLDIQSDIVAQCNVTKAQKIEYIRNTTEVTREHSGRTKLPEHLERREIIIDGLVWFNYQESRGREDPIKILKDFKGYLQTDGYGAYDFFKEKEDIAVLHCMAHVGVNFLKQKIMIKTLLNMHWIKSGSFMT